MINKFQQLRDKQAASLNSETVGSHTTLRYFGVWGYFWAI